MHGGALPYSKRVLASSGLTTIRAWVVILTIGRGRCPRPSSYKIRGMTLRRNRAGNIALTMLTRDGIAALWMLHHSRCQGVSGRPHVSGGWDYRDCRSRGGGMAATGRDACAQRLAELMSLIR